MTQIQWKNRSKHVASVSGVKQSKPISPLQSAWPTTVWNKSWMDSFPLGILKLSAVHVYEEICDCSLLPSFLFYD